MEILDKRAIEGDKPEQPEVEVNGKAEGFCPAPNRVLIKRLPPPPEGLIARPEIMQEQAERGVVIACGYTQVFEEIPVGVIAKFSKYAEEIHFDNEGSDSYVLCWIQDVRGWHNA
jgi:hypothetical protein